MADSADTKGTQASQAEGSQSASGQQSSAQPEYITLEQFNQLQGQLQTLQRSLQSDKDRAVKGVKQEVEQLKGDLLTVLQSAKVQNKSLDDLIAEQNQAEEAEFRNTIKSLAQVLQTGQFPQAGQGSPAPQGVNVSEVVKQLELPADDLRVKEFATRQFATKEDALLAGAKLIQTLSRQPTEADKPTGEQGRSQSATQLQQLQAQYEAESKGLFGQALINKKAEFRKKGLRTLS